MLSIARELLDNYMVVPFGYPNRSSVGTSPAYGTMPSTRYNSRRPILKDPESHQITKALAASAMVLMFGSRDYLQAMPRGDDDYEKARLLSRLLMAILEGSGNFRTLYQAWKDSFIFGTAILEFSWESRNRQQMTEAYIQLPDGTVQMIHVPMNAPYREGPMISQVDLFDFYPDPAGTRIQKDMSFVAKRFRITRQMAVSMANAGVYDREAVKEAFGDEDEDRSSHEGDKGGPTRFPQKHMGGPNKAGLSTGFEGWGFVPGKHADGASHRVVTEVNGVLLRDTIIPHRNGVIPFKEIVVNPMTGRFYGMSPNEANRYLQDSSDLMLMLMTEAADDMVHPQTIIGHAAQVNPITLEYNQRYIEAMNPEAIIPVKKDYNAIQVAMQQWQARKQAMRESSGTLEPLGQTLGGDRMAATTTSEIVRLASQQTELMVTLSERDDFPFIGKMIHGMLRQFSPDEGIIASLNGERLKVPFESIDIDADIRFVGSTKAQSKFQKVAAYKEAIATIASGIDLIPVMPRLFSRYLRDGLEIDDADSILAEAVAAVQQRQAQEMTMELSKQGASAPSTDSQFGTETGQTERDGRRVA